MKNGLGYGPLDLKSVSKMLLWIKDSPGYVFDYKKPKESLNVDLVAAALEATWPELALHGKKFYNSIVKQLLAQCANLGIKLQPPLYRTALRALGYE